MQTSDQLKEPVELQSIYRRRFDGMLAYRMNVWRVLVETYFQGLVPENAVVLDLGAGYGEFINHIKADKKLAMDLNPTLRNRVSADVTVILQDCSQEWQIEPGSLDVVFTSNFFEHLPDKETLKRTFGQIRRGLKAGGKLIALGPNIRYIHGAYWDFWDHFLCLTDTSLVEGLENNGFTAEKIVPRFLPYSMVGRARYPIAFVRWYLRCPPLWRLFGKQFLVTARVANDARPLAGKVAE